MKYLYIYNKKNMDNSAYKRYIVRRTELIDQKNKTYRLNFVYSSNSSFMAELYVALHFFNKCDYEIIDNSEYWRNND